MTKNDHSENCTSKEIEVFRQFWKIEISGPDPRPHRFQTRLTPLVYRYVFLHALCTCMSILTVCMYACMLVDSCVWLLIHIWVCIDVNINTGKRFLMCSINASFESQFPPLLPWRTRQSYPHIRQFSSLSTNLELFMQSCPPNNAICAAFPTLLFTLKCTI